MKKNWRRSFPLPCAFCFPGYPDYYGKLAYQGKAKGLALCCLTDCKPPACLIHSLPGCLGAVQSSSPGFFLFCPSEMAPDTHILLPRDGNQNEPERRSVTCSNAARPSHPVRRQIHAPGENSSALLTSVRIMPGKILVHGNMLPAQWFWKTGPSAS